MAERIKWHLSVPACEVLCGLKIHLSQISMGERMLLCYWLKCDDVESLIKKMWRIIRR